MDEHLPDEAAGRVERAAPDTGNTIPARLTVIEAEVPPRLTKVFSLAADGSLLKTPGGQLTRGQVEIRDIPSLATLGELIASLTGAQALCYGLPPAGVTGVVTKKAWIDAGCPAHLTPRTNDRFSWPDGPGVMMIDYDPPSDVSALCRDELVELVRSAVPGLADAALLWVPSASSYIIDSEGNDLTGLRGQRLYLLVADAFDIPRAGEVLVEHLWAAGQGWITISKSGAMLERTLVDANVWQPNRLDFAAGAACEPPLRQNRGAPVRLEGSVEIVDTRLALTDPDAATRTEAARARLEAREAAREDARAAQAAWIEERVAHAMRDADPVDEEGRARARETARLAIERGVLGGDFEIEVEDGNAYRRLTVGELLDDRSRWHGARTRDPLEPEYDGGRAVGKLYLLTAAPNLHSFAHGAQTFRLIRAPYRMQIIAGRTAELTDLVLERLRADPMTFDHGGAIATIHDGRVVHLDEVSLSHHLGGLIQFFEVRQKKNEELVEVLKDPPVQMLRQLIGLGDRRRLKPLVAVVSAPILRRDGTVLDRPGHDRASGLFLDPRGEDIPSIPVAPDRAAAGSALETLWGPFRDFPCIDAAARGGLLAALLTVALRPVLPTAPAVAFDAPVQGSGKTLLATSIGALADGRVPDLWPHTAGRDDEEVRKRLFTALRTGAPTIVWDNVVGMFDSAAMAAMLTNEYLTDRVLGQSESLRLPNRATLMLTGNNLTLSGDLARRVLVCRIDPGSETPHKRRFDRNPLEIVQRSRLEIVAAALTLVRACLTDHAAPAPGRMASFEVWDDLVRQTVAWVGRTLRPGFVEDPMLLVDRAQGADPEREALAHVLAALKARFGSEYVNARDIVDAAEMEENGTLRSALIDLHPGQRELTARGIGRLLSNRSDRIVDGLRLRKRAGGKVIAWCVETVEEAASAV